jgi:hypothetical protein
MKYKYQTKFSFNNSDTKLIITNFVFNFVTHLRRCNCGTYFIIFHCACASTFSVFDKISLKSVGFVWIVIVP